MRSVNQSFRVKLVFSRTLNSQSAGSVSMGTLAAYLRQVGFVTDLCLVDPSSVHVTESLFTGDVGRTIVIAKPNFKDFRVMLSSLEALKVENFVQRVFLCGPFARRHARDLMEKLTWLDGVIVDQLESSAKDLLSGMSEDCLSWNIETAGTLCRNPVTGVLARYTARTDLVPLAQLPPPARDVEAAENVGFVNIEASRGCLFRCSFCHVPLMAGGSGTVHGSLVDVRDPVAVVDEMQRLNGELGKTLFIFNDSCFWATNRDDARILHFCNEIARRRLDIHMYVYLKGEPMIGDVVLHRLVEAGLIRVFLGVENSVPETLKTYRKRIRPDLYETMRARLDPLGVNIHIGYITFEPHSSLDDIRANIEYLFRIGKLFRLGVILEPVRVIPGTELHRQLVSEGLMSADTGYAETTYGYRFVHPLVGMLLSRWKHLFEGVLSGVAYGFEYHATVGELLWVIAQRTDSKVAEAIRRPYNAFVCTRQRGMELLHHHFLADIERVRSGLAESAAGVTRDQQFEERFRALAAEMEVRYGSMVLTALRSGGSRVVREVYPG